MGETELPEINSEEGQSRQLPTEGEVRQEGRSLADELKEKGVEAVVAKLQEAGYTRRDIESAMGPKGEIRRQAKEFREQLYIKDEIVSPKGKPTEAVDRYFGKRLQELDGQYDTVETLYTADEVRVIHNAFRSGELEPTERHLHDMGIRLALDVEKNLDMMGPADPVSGIANDIPAMKAITNGWHFETAIKLETMVGGMGKKV